MGGKSYIAKWIISYFPVHNVYCEVFGGAGHILFTKSKSPVEVYNDLDDNLTNLFIQIRDNKDKLLNLLENNTPVSRALFQKYLKTYQEGMEIDRAFKYFYVLNLSFNSDIKGKSFRITKTRSESHRYFFKVDLIKLCSDRLKDIVIENVDFRRLIRLYDSPDTLFYLDPPYYDKERYYTFNFSETDHKDLADILQNIRGKAILSYYESLPLSYYKDWYQVSKRVVKHSDKLNKSRTDEVLLMNFKPLVQSFLPIV